MAGNARRQVGRPREHAEGWNSANKRICISNDTFTKRRSLKERLSLANDNAVACYLISSVESLNEALQPEMRLMP